MKILRFARYPLGLCVVAALLAGCGGSHPQVVAPGAMPEAPAIATHTARGTSWMLPEATLGDLLYVSQTAIHGDGVKVFTYPGGKHVGTLTGFYNPMGLCSDKNGNVWVTNAIYYGGDLVEYAHGGRSPIATLQDSNYTPVTCSVDPGTGNLAAGNLEANIAVYANAQAPPTFYSTSGLVENVNTITYDGSGDLYFRMFLGGNHQAWLPKGGSTVMPFSVSSNGPYQWDGQYLAVMRQLGSRDSEPDDGVMRYALSGSKGTKVGKVRLDNCYQGRFAFAGSTIAVSCGTRVSIYNYPAGGNPINTISVTSAYGVAISAPSRSRIRK